MDISQIKPIDINLLQEGKRRAGFSILALLIVGLAVGGLLLPGWLWMEASGRIAAYTSKIAGISQLQHQLESQVLSTHPGIDAASLVQLPAQLQRYKPQTTVWLQELNRLLPLESNVTSIAYSPEGRLLLSLSFPSAEQVVTVLREIEQSDSFKLISLGNLTNEQVKADEEAYTDRKVLPMTRTVIELDYQPSVEVKTGGSS